MLKFAVTPPILRNPPDPLRLICFSPSYLYEPTKLFFPFTQGVLWVVSELFEYSVSWCVFRSSHFNLFWVIALCRSLASLFAIIIDCRTQTGWNEGCSLPPPCWLSFPGGFRTTSLTTAPSAWLFWRCCRFLGLLITTNRSLLYFICLLLFLLW